MLVGWVSGGKVGCGWDGRRFEMFRKVCVDCMKFVVVFVVVGGRGGETDMISCCNVCFVLLMSSCDRLLGCEYCCNRVYIYHLVLIGCCSCCCCKIKTSFVFLK